MKDALRRLAWKVAPDRMADRAVLWNERVRRDRGVTAEARQYVLEHGATVSSGPFAGLRYPQGLEAQIDAMVPKLTGSYEAELHRVIDEALERRPPVFVDVGTADGYYAVGFARQSNAEVFGFELAPRARRLCSELARLNEVSVHLHGRATGRQLRTLPLEDAFVLSDCEGTEADIFDEDSVAALRTALVVIEVHDWARPGVERLLVDRFQLSHDIELITGSTPDAFRFDEGRWLVLRPRPG